MVTAELTGVIDTDGLMSTMGEDNPGSFFGSFLILSGVGSWPLFLVSMNSGVTPSESFLLGSALLLDDVLIKFRVFF